MLKVTQQTKLDGVLLYYMNIHFNAVNSLNSSLRLMKKLYRFAVLFQYQYYGLNWSH